MACKKAAPHPMFRGWKPSTSLPGSKLSIIASSSICRGSGSCTSTPSILGFLQASRGPAAVFAASPQRIPAAGLACTLAPARAGKHWPGRISEKPTLGPNHGEGFVHLKGWPSLQCSRTQQPASQPARRPAGRTGRQAGPLPLQVPKTVPKTIRLG
jgi:hypothetical protein